VLESGIFILMPEVVFQYQDKTKHVRKDVLSCLKKYLHEYSTKERIILSDLCDFDVFCHFIDFLESGVIPSDRNDQIGVINLLREWESHFGILDGFRFRLCCQEKDGIVVYNGDKYYVNIECLFFHSGVFREFYKNSCGMVFNFDSSYSRESFEVFLDLIHNRISYPSVEKAGDVYDICNCLHCDSLCQLLNDDSSERVLSLLIQNQDQNHNDSIDLSKYERSITQKIDIYLKNPSFCLVSLPSLCRIFADSNQTFSVSSLEPFLIGCMKHHGTGAQLLLNKIKYQKPSDLSELNRILRIMSIEDANDIYENTNHVVSSFQREFESLRVENRQLSESIQQTISEMKRISQKYEHSLNEMNIRLKEQESINKKMDSEINSAKAIIGEQKNMIQEKDSTIAENIRLLQAKDAAINEKNIQIQAKDDQLAQIKKRSEFPFLSDLFSGIFNGLSKKLGRNLADSSDVDVTASSIMDSPNGPKNVMKNDDSYWHSQDIPNSWIQFDFKQNKVSITSYSLHVFYCLKSWKVEGSINGSTFDIIDNKVDTICFKDCEGKFYDPNSQKNFSVQPNNKFYKIIRITSTSKKWNNNDQFNLYRVEFFGFVQSD